VLGGKESIGNRKSKIGNSEDWLGTERARSNSSGARCETITSLPFGDGQTTAGSCGDPSPNHFTGKERDAESGLDHFGARYNASSLGRFMSPDPLLNSGQPWDPQSWNRYSYARNNPLAIVDPTGLYDLLNTCAQDDEKCNKQFRRHADDLKKGLLRLQKKVDKMKEGVEKTRLENALKAMGTERDNNGVTVTFGAVSNGAAETTFGYNEQTGQVTDAVTLDPSKMTGGTNDWAIDAAHEGTHIADTEDPRYNKPATTLSPFSGEYRAYQTSAWATSALGLSNLSYGGGRYQIWNSSWGAVDDKVLARYISENYKYSNGKPYKETTPHNPWGD
jgi:RHS repeat-associated protein